MDSNLNLAPTEAAGRAIVLDVHSSSVVGQC
jgi:hypothetical protein